MIPSKKELEIIISKIKSFENPKPELEQYQTPSDIAAELLWTAFMDGNIKEKSVADLGTGTGIFAIGASLLGAKKVVGYDIDNDVLKIARENLKKIKEYFPVKNITFEKGEISNIKGKFDTVIMNPPFGVQKRHADKEFLERAFAIAKNTVYSIHKSGMENDKFLEQIAANNHFLASKITEKNFILNSTMEFHKKEKHPVSVTLWRFTMLN